VDHGARYTEMARQSRDAFIQQAAPAALVRLSHSNDADEADDPDQSSTMVISSKDVDTVGSTSSHGHIELHPLAKKPGAPFSGMITVGRTANNDVVLNHVTISRFHAYFKSVDGGWCVCDSGSKNGTHMQGNRLDARKEVPLESGTALVFGELSATFMTAGALYDFLVGQA